MPRPSDAFPGLRPVAPPRNLTREIAERIANHIVSAKLLPGAKLPTEQEMVAAMGVSRTVVREAVAALRADGLVVTRQGAGAFVAPDAERRPFRLASGDTVAIAEADIGQPRVRRGCRPPGLRKCRRPKPRHYDRARRS